MENCHRIQIFIQFWFAMCKTLFFGSVSAEIRHLSYMSKVAVNTCYLLKVTTKPFWVATSHDTRLNSYMLPRLHVTLSTFLTVIVFICIAKKLRKVEVFDKNSNIKILTSMPKTFWRIWCGCKCCFSKIWQSSYYKSQLPFLENCSGNCSLRFALSWRNTTFNHIKFSKKIARMSWILIVVFLLRTFTFRSSSITHINTNSVMEVKGVTCNRGKM